MNLSPAAPWRIAAGRKYTVPVDSRARLSYDIFKLREGGFLYGGLQEIAVIRYDMNAGRADVPVCLRY